ncbi:MAG: hypothetical protein ABGW69_03710, partial [Nanoarchaeota archaeon]
AIDLLKYGYIKEIREDKSKNKFEEPIKISKANEFTEKDEEILRLKKELLLKELQIKKLKHIIWLKNKKIKELSLKLKNCKKEEKEKCFNILKGLKKENLELKRKINSFSKILEGLINNQYVLLWDWKKRFYTKYSFIDEKELENANKNELEKFRKLVKSSNLSWFERFNDVIIAKKSEVENALMPTEDEIKKIKEYLKIYKIRRKEMF